MAEQEQSAEQIFGVALDLPPEQRSAYLVRACHESPALRTLLEQLLADYKRMGAFLDEAALPSGSNTTFTCSPDTIGLPAGFSFGRYTILDPLGSGAMGAVYRARDERLEREVAIKILSPGVLGDEEGRRRFRREALALAKLGHARIAAIYDVGEHDGIDFIVMECVPGETLAATLRSGPLSVKDATWIGLQIAEALEDAHEHGVIHRDLKPANIMVTPKRQVKVLDFGIAKLLAARPDATASIETSFLAGTPLYMSPEQAEGRAVDVRTDLWSLGVLYAEALTGKNPFAASGTIAVLNRIVYEAPTSLHDLRPDADHETQTDAQRIVTRALQKDSAARYQTAAEMAADLSELHSSFTATTILAKPTLRSRRGIFGLVAAVLVLLVAAGAWFYHHSSSERWASEDALPQMQALLGKYQPLAAFLIWQKAHSYIPDDHQLQLFADDNTTTVSIDSSPAKADVQVQDYATPNAKWYSLGTTPLTAVRLPKANLRWKVSKSGYGEILAAPPTTEKMSFDLDAARRAPEGMVYAPGGRWANWVAFVGLLGPYDVPPFYVDRHEVTNRDFQRFVDSGGYQNKKYWPAEFIQQDGKAGRKLTFDEAMALFRDTTDRPGPSTWAAGHYPEGQADLPVTGVSWFEATAYASFAGKSLPVVAQWFQIAPADRGGTIVPASNIGSQHGLAPVESYKGLGPLGTYDTAGNAREWVWNTIDNDLRFILGGAWNSPNYFYYEGDAVQPFDRSAINGFRCVRNLAPMAATALQPVHRVLRDFSHFKPSPESVFSAYKLLYDYPNVPFDTVSGGIVRETEDWREEKVTFNAGYRGERMAAYLFLPKHVRPPFQTVLFFPSARILLYKTNDQGRQLGDMQFFDYVLQSGRAVMYPIYQDTYERKMHFYMPGASQFIQITTDQYKDAARSLDYLATRPDIDNTRLAYLGVSMGSAQGVINAELMQNRLKTAVFLDGGYFLDHPVPGADQAEFASRLKIPVLMVNGRYDYVFSVDLAQNPLFDMLATPPADKRHVLLDTGHDVTDRRPQLVHEVLDWLDKYLGRVSY